MKYLIYFFTSLLLSLAWTSCVHEEPNSCNEENALVLRVQTQNIRATEPGQDVYNENKVGAVTILFYLDGQMKWQVKSTDYQVNNGAYIIPVTEAMRPLFNGTNNFNIYVVANHDFTAPAAEADLPQQIVTKSIAVTATVQPADFVMMAHGSKAIDMVTAEGKQLGEYQLKRVAAKIRLTKPAIEVAGYEVVGEVQAKLRNSATQAFLSTEANAMPSVTNLYATSDYLDITELYPTAASTTSRHFYSYYNKWEITTAQEKRPEFFVKVLLKKEGTDDNTAKAYYYRVPVEAAENQIRSNYLYNLNVRIEILGGLQEPEAVAVSGQLKIEDWITHQDEFGLPATEYLSVEEHEVQMNNISEHAITYRSSQPIHVEIKSATFTYVSTADGQEHNDPVTHDQYPSISISSNKIAITSKIPVNNVPKKIVLEVTNGIDGLKEIIVIYQYPAQYIIHTMGKYSSLSPNGNYLNPAHNNKAIYHIVVLVPPVDLNAYLGYPITDGSGANIVTQNSLETPGMLSPSFELASQLGATSPMYYSQAQQNCKDYWEERMENGQLKKLDDWRLPTDAEIALVDKLQHDPASAVKIIMRGNYYWDSYSQDGAHKMDKPITQNANSSKAHVRCVRDVKTPIRGKNRTSSLK